ncbi:MAG TPA: HAD family hydrolase [Pyrinomonadaceae bacterium]|jgi:D-glycero-D-manno-heptose 1,7-bisphosphate phosphatase
MTKDKGRKAVFIDRDGTLIEEVNFLSRAEDLRFFSFTGEAVRLLKENGFLVIVITNQSGIGRGIFTEAAMRGIHEIIQTKLTEKIDAFYFCPHLPDAGCACRKPKIGMIKQALADFAIDLENSWFVGDKAIDVETGRNANVKTALVLTGYGKQAIEQLEIQPDLTAKNLLQAARRIVNRE